MKRPERTEKIEIDKGKGNYFYYTGTLEDTEDGWVRIHTTRGEVMTFRKEQILQRQELTGDDTNGKGTEDHKR